MARSPPSPGRPRVWFALLVALFVGLALLIWPRTDEVPAAPQPVASADGVPTAPPSTPPPTRATQEAPAPVSTSSSPAIAGIAFALGRLELTCDVPDDLSQAPTQSLTGALVSDRIEGWSQLLGELRAGVLTLTVPPQDGEARVRIEQMGTLRVRWSVSAGEVARCEQVRWEARLGGVHGRVQDGAGAPLPGAAVKACVGGTRADESGAFYLTLPVGRACALHAEWAGGTSSGQSPDVVVTPQLGNDVVDVVLVVDLVEREDPPATEREREAQAVRDLCRHMEEAIVAHPRSAARLREIYRDRLDACERAIIALEAGADPDALFDEVIRAGRPPEAPEAPPTDGEGEQPEPDPPSD